jgi:apolipoprotein D and lipocalin family protein
MAPRMLAIALCLGLLAWLSPMAQARKLQPAVQTVTQVDLKRYMGKWYEIAAIPMFFERRCVGNTLADYGLLPNGLVEVVNSCKINTGRRISSVGRAKVIDRQTHAKLKVTFLNLLGWRFLAGGDYWILALDPDYRYAVVGHPTRRYGWILSRTPSLPQATLAAISAQLARQGYDPCLFMTTPQFNGLSQQRSLCQVAPAAKH